MTPQELKYNCELLGASNYFKRCNMKARGETMGQFKVESNVNYWYLNNGFTIVAVFDKLTFKQIWRYDNGHLRIAGIPTYPAAKY